MKNNVCPYSYLVKPIGEGENMGYRAIVPKFPNMLIMADNPKELHDITVDIVSNEIKKLKKAGKKIPEADFMGKYNGKILFRTSPEIHEELVLEATAKSISLNKLIEEKISGSHK